MAYRNPPPSFGQVVEWFAPTMIGTAALVLGMLLCVVDLAIRPKSGSSRSLGRSKILVVCSSISAVFNVMVGGG